MTPLVDAIQQLSLARSMEQIMRIVQTAARSLTGADGVAFILRDGDECFHADEDAIGPLWKGRRFPIAECISGWTMLNRKPVFIEDIYQDDRIPHDTYRPTFVKSLAMVPIRTTDPVGAIGCYWAANRMPTEHEKDVLQSLAESAAAALENVNLYQSLERRVAECSGELASANRKLQMVNAELETFAYSVSHDLRAPLRAILGYSLIIEEDCYAALNDSGKKALEAVRRGGIRMNNMIDDLLAFTRLANKEVVKTLVDSEEIIRTCIGSFENPVVSKVTITIGPLPSVSADKSLLERVWRNLISNAIKFSSYKEYPTIVIGHEERPGEDVFFVKDNGVGFKQAYASKLFKVFQRLHDEREFEGTGMGLASVRRTVERHGGTVWAEGVVNQGATFFFSLPRQEPERSAFPEID